MSLTALSTPLSEVQADWLIVGAWQDEAPTGALAQLDTRLGGILSRLQQSADIAGKPHELTPLLDCHGVAAKRILVVGLGKRDKIDRASLHDAAAALCSGGQLKA